MVTKAKAVELREQGLFIQWEDGHQSLYPYKGLRSQCRCAHCVDERSGKRLLNVAAIPDDIRALDWLEVGNYALQFLWTDAHSTGIYTFEHLRQLCPCPACAAKAS
jgi:DUF971 family protein